MNYTLDLPRWSSRRLKITRNECEERVNEHTVDSHNSSTLYIAG